MKSALIIAAILGIVNPAAKVDKSCKLCCGTGFWTNAFYWSIDDGRFRWDRPDNFRHCKRCDGYGKEQAIYGGLLKSK